MEGPYPTGNRPGSDRKPAQIRPGTGPSLGRVGDARCRNTRRAQHLATGLSHCHWGPVRARGSSRYGDEREGTTVTNSATLLSALRAVPGVASADIEPDERPEGAGTLRLQLDPGADEVAVATSVNRVLREQFGLAVDANRVQVVEESAPVRHSDPLTDPLSAVLAHEPHVPAPEPLPARPTLTAVPGYLGTIHGDAGDAPSASSGGASPGGSPTLEAEPAVPTSPMGFDQGLADYASPAAAPPPASAAEPVEPVLVDTVETSPEVSDEVSSELLTLPVRSPRILIARMQLVSAGLGVTTEVTLSWLGDAFAGQAAAAATPTSVHRSVAQATLRAVESVVGNRARFELEQLEINQLGPDRAVVVVVSMLTKAGSERLTGVSVVREDVRQAVIRATLDALNRRLESLLLSA